jgi:hypothetical protein
MLADEDSGSLMAACWICFVAQHKPVKSAGLERTPNGFCELLPRRRVCSRISLHVIYPTRPQVCYHRFAEGDRKAASYEKAPVVPELSIKRHSSSMDVIFHQIFPCDLHDKNSLKSDTAVCYVRLSFSCGNIESASVAYPTKKRVTRRSTSRLQLYHAPRLTSPTRISTYSNCPPPIGRRTYASYERIPHHLERKL